MAIQHRDIIKVMPIAPVTMRTERPMPARADVRKATLRLPNRVQISTTEVGVCWEMLNEA